MGFSRSTIYILSFIQWLFADVSVIYKQFVGLRK
jgi:hypothetical protein